MKAAEVYNLQYRLGLFHVKVSRSKFTKKEVNKGFNPPPVICFSVIV